MQSPQRKPQNSWSGFFALSLSLAACALYYFSEDSGTEAPTPAVSEFTKLVRSDAKSEQAVNKYLQETGKKIEAQKQKSAIENAFIAPVVGQLVPLRPEAKKPLAVEPPQDSDSLAGHRKLAPDVSRDDSSPRSEVEGQLADRQKLEEYDRGYRQQYVQEFIANARKNGWSIQVDKDGVVTRAYPIPGFDPQAQEHSVNVFAPSVSDSGE